MDTQHERRAAELFKAALDHADPAERAAFLDRQCAGDADLRAAVEALLAADAAPSTSAERSGHPGPQAAESPAEGETVTLPLKPATAQTLARWPLTHGVKGWRAQADGTDPDARPFGKLPDKTAKMVRADLTDAGIAYQDDSDRVADFHAIRHTYVSNLARGGVHPKIAQQLARHSTITLTMDRYTHTAVGELSDALAALPDLEDNQPDRDRLRTMGTDDRDAIVDTAGRMATSMATGMANQPAPTALLGASSCNEAGGFSKKRDRVERGEMGISCHSTHSVAPTCSENGEGGIRTPGTGLNPFNGLANRRFKPLSHLSSAVLT